MEALSTISALPSTKEQGMTFFKSLKNEILAGTHDPLKLLVALKVIEKTVGDILKDEDIEYCFQKEFSLFEKEKVLNINGSKLSLAEVGTKYEYEASGDPVWNDLSGNIAELTEKRKEREKFLQNIPYDQGVVDPDTGVFITRPPKSSKTKVKVIL